MSVSGRAPPPSGCAPPGTRSGREAWPLGPFGGVAAARPPAGRGASAPAGRGAVRHGAAPACAHCHGVQGHAGRRRKCRRGILFAPEDALDYMGCHPRGTRGRPRSHAGRGGASRPVTGRVGVRPSLSCITRPCRARYSWPMRLRAYAQLLWVPSSAPAPSVGSRRPVECSHPRRRKFRHFCLRGCWRRAAPPPPGSPRASMGFSRPTMNPCRVWAPSAPRARRAPPSSATDHLAGPRALNLLFFECDIYSSLELAQLALPSLLREPVEI